MKTVVFKWNPSFLSYSMFHFLRNIVKLSLDPMEHYNWNILSYKQNDLAYWNK